VKSSPSKFSPNFLLRFLHSPSSSVVPISRSAFAVPPLVRPTMSTHNSVVAGEKDQLNELRNLKKNMADMKSENEKLVAQVEGEKGRVTVTDP